jgi:hypothetical protein
VTAGPSSDVLDAIIFLALVVVLIARRTYLMIQGTRYSTGRLVVFSAFYVLIFAVLGFATLYAAVGTWGSVAWGLLAPYAGVPIVTAFLAVPYVRRIVRFDRRADGTWFYRLPWVVPVVYLTLFIARFALEIVIFGFAYVTSFFLPTSLPTALLVILVALDLMFGASAGLLVGRSVGVYRGYRDLPPPSAAAPLPQGPTG